MRLVAQERWIIDGNYNSTLELRFRAADAVVFLDIARITCMISALKRHGKKRSDLPQYLEEKVDAEFLQFCKWIWEFKKTGRQTIMRLHEKYPDKPFFKIAGRREMHRTLEMLGTTAD